LSESNQPAYAVTDFVGYEALVDFIEERRLYELEGDIIEIGAFMGGGTVKLAEYARKHGKKVYAIDVFDTGYDRTRDTTGIRMCDIYDAFLQGRSQQEVYRRITENYDNIITIDKDSKEVEFPGEQSFVFGFIDGNHDPEYVRNDFYLVWHSLVPGGCVGLHDYDFDLPDVTEAVDSLVKEHRDEIEDVHRIKEKYIILLTKKSQVG
jgi:predicted O-methyltransferase YrrM